MENEDFKCYFTLCEVWKERQLILEAIVLGLALGFVRNGRLNNFADMKFRGGFLIILGFIAFVMPFISGILGFDLDNIQLYPFIAGIIGMLVIIFNIEKSGMKLILLGGLINLIIIGLNHFQMPVDLTKMAAAGMGSLVDSIQSGSIINLIGLENSHFLSQYLGKIFILPSWYPLNKLLSIGDIIMSIGIIFLVQGEMMMFSSKRGNMVTFQYNPHK